MSLQVFRATLAKNLLIQLRAYPVSFMLGNLLTGLYANLGAWLMYNYLFTGNLSPSFEGYSGTSDYMSYTIIGTVVYIFVVRTCLNVSRSLVSELREGTLESLMLAPFHRAAYFLGNMTVQTVTTALEAVCSVVIGLFFGLRLGGGSLLLFCAAVPLSLYAFFGVSMILGCVMLYTRNTYITQNTLFAVLFLVCGITFPVQYLPPALQWLSSLIPVTQAVTLMRASVLGSVPIGELLGVAVHLLLVSSVYISAGFPLMKRAELAALEGMEG